MKLNFLKYNVSYGVKPLREQCKGGGGGYFGIISRKMSLSTYLNLKKLGVANCYGNHSNRIHKKSASRKFHQNFAKVEIQKSKQTVN